ncbi:IclR family transcriptional regulator [Mycobacterium saskatchewanense]|nr:IclR family transcriptional regulator [Mycobacterium saskatchewanense]BBX66005.1 IclR family transcriptional regulator [Mycobacterium saskatchewanense]
MTLLLSQPDVRRSDKAARSGVVERVTQVMEVFGPHRQSARLEEVAEHAALPRSTTFRILRQLVEMGWLEHGPDGFRLGTRLRELHGCTVDYTDVRAAASPVLTDLNLTTGAVSHLGVLEGSFVHYLDKVGGVAAHSVPSQVGARLGAEETVTGRALLAQLPPEDVDRRYAADGRRACGDGMSIEQLHRRLDLVRRRRGLAFSSAEGCAMGISSVAAPVLGSQGVVAAISVAARRNMRLEAIGPVVAAAARTTSTRLVPDWRESSCTGPGEKCGG